MPSIQEALDRIWSDQALKGRLLSDPKAVLSEFGVNVPDSVKVEVHENTPTLINAVLPEKSSQPVATTPTDPISRVMQRAWADSAFKNKLLSKPKDAVAEMGIKIPDGVDLKIWENKPGVEHMVLPVNPADSELSDADLEAVAGGAMSKGDQVAIGCGVGGGVAAGAGLALAFTAIGAAIGAAAAGVAVAGGSTGGSLAASHGGKC